MLERVRCERTSSDKNSKLYDLLPHRGPEVYTSIYNALRKTGNQELAESLMEGLCETGGKTPPPVSLTLPSRKEVKFCEPLTEFVSQMRPLETPSVRGNHLAYKTAIDIYPGDLPKTQVGMNELPFVAALALGYSKDAVTGWNSCPAVLALDAAYKIYISEIQKVENFLLALDGGGIEIMVMNTTVLGIVAIMEMLQAPSWVQIRNLKICEFSETNKRRLAVQLHAIMIGSPLSFILRKDLDAKPPAYLCYNAAPLCKLTPIILRDSDRSLIDEVLNQDETNHAASFNSTTCCPFTWGQSRPTAPAAWM
jgi:hypothetical protein